MGKVVKTVVSVGAIVAGVALAIPSGGSSLLAVKLGVSSLGASLIAGSLAVGNALLSRGARAPQNSPENANRLRASIDPLTPRKTCIGITALATDIRDEEYSDDQEFLHRFIVCASHKVQSIDEVWFDDELAWSSTGGIASKFVGYLGVEGYAEGSAANAKNISARMGSTRRYTGLAWLYLRYKLTGNDKKSDGPFAQSIPSRITIRGKAALLPDPRNPAHDMDDQSTWTWDDSACRNPALALLFYLLGWRINGKLAVGKGIPAERIDLDSFITAANICDESVPKVGGGTEPRYRCDGVWSEGDSPTAVIDTLKACMNADLDDVGGKLRLTVFHNDLATPVADFGDNDIIDAFSWQPLPPLDATSNIVRGLYTDPSNQSLYQQVDYPEQRVSSPDGIDRIDTFNLPMVQSLGQAQRLAGLRLRRQQYAGFFEAEFQANAWKVTKNSVIRLTFKQTGFVQKFFRVVEMEIRQDGRVPMKLREEDPAIYGDPPFTQPISPIFPSPFDPANSPYAQALATIEEGATRNVPRGTYSNGDTYVRGDYVLFSGSSYQLIVETSTGNPPPDALRWALIASAGSGTPGDNGLEGITVIVTNEAHTVATAANGSGGNYSTAGGQMTLRRGATLLEPTFSIAAATPNTGWIAINSAGVYTVSDPGVDLATATIRATWAGVNYDRTYTLAKSKQGVDGPTVALVVNNQAFTFTNGVPNPASQTITFEALLTNISGTATWSTTPSVTLGGSGNTRTLSIASFGVNRQVTVQATLGGLTDRITIVRLERDLNTEVVLQGTLAARPTTGQFVGQNYLVTSGTDAGVLFAWNGSDWVAGPTRGAPPGTLVGGVEASGLVDDAARAKADAAQSLIDLTAIASDSVLTRGEKINVRERRDNISNEFPIWRDRGIALGISPDTRASYQQSYDELIAYLAAINVNANSNTNITRADFVAAFNNYALARERVIDAVSVAASQRADWGQVGARPNSLIDLRADGRLRSENIGYEGITGQSINDLRPLESLANRTESRTAAAVLFQGTLATRNEVSWGSEVAGRPGALTNLRSDGRILADQVGYNGFTSGNSVNDFKPQEVNANRTENRVAASVLYQGPLATSTIPYTTMNGRQRLDSVDVYYADGIYVSSLRPQEVNSNRTEGRVASSVLNQTSWATLTASTNRLSRINDFGRISDPTIYNAQAILGPRNVSAIVPTYTVGGSNVTINLPAHTRRIAGPSGPITLSYGAASGVEPFNAYWAAFVDDPNLTGFSSPNVQITNDPATLLFPGRYHIASGVTPAAGGSGGSTGSGTGGGSNSSGGFTAPNIPPGTNYP